MLFRVGKVSVSSAVLESHITPADLVTAFERYIRGDWGDIDNGADVHNDLAIADGSRITAIYTTFGGLRVTITTFAGRTQVLFPEEVSEFVGEAIA